MKTIKCGCGDEECNRALGVRINEDVMNLIVWRDAIPVGVTLSYQGAADLISALRGYLEAEDKREEEETP